ncbi:O-antigen translocase [Pedobacter jeongneungensis]|uniref:O-antigen translocase n=1 Tax=Pedobacter jeongneungensis TaxID=947309 RepID=UPI000690C2A6|nr:O-antigen translocase [Pedobacter jeongneungensis]
MVKTIQDKWKVIISVLKTDIVKVFSFTAMATVVKMFTALVSIKLVALLIGPSGIALVGQLNNFSTIIMLLACGGINNGVTKYIAEYRESSETIKNLMATAFKITLICSFVCGLSMVIFNEYLSEKLMLDKKYDYLFVIFGITVVFYALNALIASILNGFKDFRKYVFISIVGSIVGLIFTIILVLWQGLKGALIGAVTFQSIMFFVSIWMIRKLPWFSLDYFNRKIDLLLSKKYMKYSVMTLVTAVTAPVSQLILRGYVISNISSIEAGWWEGMNRISTMYLMVITTSFSVYYLPRLSELVDRRQLRVEILKAFKIIVPTLIVAFLTLYICRFLIIRLIFTKDFVHMENLFLWQLIGDFFKITSWILAYLMVAKTMTKSFISTEIIFSIVFMGLAYLFVRQNGILGITQAYAINYFIYFLCMLVLFRKLLFTTSSDER